MTKEQEGLNGGRVLRSLLLLCNPVVERRGGRANGMGHRVAGSGGFADGPGAGRRDTGNRLDVVWALNQIRDSALHRNSRRAMSGEVGAMRKAS